MNTADIYPSKYLKAADLNGGIMAATVDNFAMEEVGHPPELRAVVYLKECRALICNITNKNMLESLLGTETDDWIGQQIELVSMPVTYKGDTVQAVRVQPFRKPLPPNAESGAGEEPPF